MRLFHYPLGLLAVVTLSTSALADLRVKNGDKVAFVGDSITQQGWESPTGYIHLVVAGLAANGVTIKPVPAGIAGNKSSDLLLRLDHDVLSIKPQWLTLNCGVNDVRTGTEGPALERFKKYVTGILNQSTTAKVNVLLTTATVIKEDLANAENTKLAAYNDVLRQLATRRHVPLADLNAMFQERIKKENQPGKHVLTRDGVHLNPEGDKMMARGILLAFGCNSAQLKKAEKTWAAKK